MTNHMRRAAATALAALVAAVVSTLPVAGQGDRQTTIPANPPQAGEGRLEISAFAVNMSTIGTGANASVRITINSWSTPEEREQLATVLVEKNQDALLRTLQRMPSRGRFSIPGLIGPDPHQLRLGHDLRYAWQTPGDDGGRRIVIATDRYIGFAEARNQPRSIDYPFTLFEIRVDKNGEGEGKMAVATQITFEKNTRTLQLENYSSEPVRLQNVRVTPAS